MLKKLFSPVLAVLALGAMALSAPAAAQVRSPQLTGVGATFPAPLYTKWFGQYRGAATTFDAVGSTGGINAIINKQADFGASDAPLDDGQMTGANSDLLHIPTALGGIVLAYNIPGVKEPLKLSADNIVAIFEGRIRSWSAPELVLNNPQLTSVTQDIIIVRRQDGSGSTYAFTRYLSDVSASWRYAPDRGYGTIITWPRGVSAVGNGGVVDTLNENPFSIGYVDLNYAIKNKLAYASVLNKAGVYVAPTIASINAAAASADHKSNDLRVNLINAPGKDAYPIVTATYVLVHRNQDDFDRGVALSKLLWWMTHEGQSENEALLYGKVPASMAAKSEEAIKSMVSADKRLMAK